jgi:hypothetical protein
MSDYIPSGDAVRRLGVTTDTINSWCNKGLIKHTRIKAGKYFRYFVCRESFEQLLRDGEVTPDPKRTPGRPDRFKLFNLGTFRARA